MNDDEARVAGHAVTAIKDIDTQFELIYFAHRIFDAHKRPNNYHIENIRNATGVQNRVKQLPGNIV